LFRFCKLMIQFRRDHSMLRSPWHGGPAAPELAWHGTRAHLPDWSGASRVLAFQRTQASADRRTSIYVAMNMHWESLDVELPNAPHGTSWQIVANTALPSPRDISESGSEPVLAQRGLFSVGGRSVLVLVAK
jgi:pullulanase/glycogen debranching enzyme